MKEVDRILYQSERDIPIMKTLIIIIGVFMITFPFYLFFFNSISFLTILSSICLLLFGIGITFEGIKDTTQNVIITKKKIDIIPNQFGTNNNQPIETIWRDELLSIRTDGYNLKFIIKDRVINDYQKQDEIHIKTSSWRKASKLRQEIKDTLKRTQTPNNQIRRSK